MILKEIKTGIEAAMLVSCSAVAQGKNSKRRPLTVQRRKQRAPRTRGGTINTEFKIRANASVYLSELRGTRKTESDRVSAVCGGIHLRAPLKLTCSVLLRAPAETGDPVTAVGFDTILEKFIYKKKERKSPQSPTSPSDGTLSPTGKKKRRFKWPKKKTSRDRDPEFHNDPLFFSDPEDHNAAKNNLNFDQVSVQTEYSVQSECLSEDSTSTYSLDMSHRSATSPRSRKNSDEKQSVLVRIGSFFAKRRKSSRSHSDSKEDGGFPTRARGPELPDAEGSRTPTGSPREARRNAGNAGNAGASLPELRIGRLRESPGSRSVVSLLDGEGIPFADSDSSGRSSVKEAGSQEGVAVGVGGSGGAAGVPGGDERQRRAGAGGGAGEGVGPDGQPAVRTTVKHNFEVVSKARPASWDPAETRDGAAFVRTTALEGQAQRSQSCSDHTEAPVWVRAPHVGEEEPNSGRPRPPMAARPRPRDVARR
ncbi:hypothetical protein COCON_G00001330 [Conger conger]|uniref:Uncharacterized protein n=1 Tax=Conger conger TaxID=82655 RepID=A0A9Q1I7B3_CONCO|nr:hypothetical protein COCON_G00001330 [Conger conger]